MALHHHRSTGRAAKSLRRSWGFWAIAYTYVVLLAGTNLPTPLYRGYQQEFGFSSLGITLIYASYAFTLIPSLLLAGSLSDAVGRRRVLLPALAGAIAGSVVFIMADGIAWLFVARALQGISVGVASGAMVAALTEREPNGDHRRAALVATVAPVAGITLGPLLSGLLAEYLPAPQVLPFLTVIALLVPGIIAAISMPDAGARTRWTPQRPQVPAAIRADFAVSAMSSFAAWAVAGLFLALLPSYVVTLTGSDNLAVGGAVVAVMLGCSAVAQRAGYGRHPGPVRTVGLVLLTAGLVLLIVAGLTASLILLLAASMLAGAGHGLTFLGGMTEINRIAPPERRAGIVSTFLVATYLGSSIPVIGVGIVASTTGLVTAVQWFAIAVAALCVVLWVALRRIGRIS